MHKHNMSVGMQKYNMQSSNLLKNGVNEGITLLQKNRCKPRKSN